ncbi:Ubiquitin-protein ligase E3B [Dermatophagoides farinae]|uniref:Ubiquitin-protein ligase E3B n=1 Tax=Dermatophagoides farinae TaxID=6954 RepID=A0A922I0E3_DERFA|nr:ubiquitin-protein ligase E3B-like isoform X2 [Dermatophagoides farinae]KAH7646304.1 ubiquitin-protein ligase e3b-like protein [Dermatophagoides farinae]KAH9516742.1 Ubiquitin-protein ligase E3B [Dermatophagoides farinae]
MFDSGSSKKSADRDKFLEATRQAREERERDRRLNGAATKIQAAFRSYHSRDRFIQKVYKELDQMLKTNDNDKDENKDDESSSQRSKNKIKSLELFYILKKLLFVIRSKTIKNQLVKSSENPVIDLSDPSYHYFENICKQTFLTSLFSSDPQYSYVGILILHPELTTDWKQQIIYIATTACSFLKQLKPEQPNHQGSIVIFLNILVSFTSTSSWLILRQNDYDQYRILGEKICHQVINELVSHNLFECLNDLLMKGLTRTKPSLKKLSLTAIITISIRPLQNSSYSDQNIRKFLLYIFSLPALIYHLNILAPEAIQILYREPILKRSIELLSVEEHSRELFAQLEGNYTLCLLANHVNLAFISFKSIQTSMIEFVCIIKKMLDSCQKYVISKQSSTTHWHPVLGWFSQNVDQKLHESMIHVKSQLQYLWNPQMIEIIFTSLFKLVSLQQKNCSEKTITPIVSNNNNGSLSNDSLSTNTATSSTTFSSLSTSSSFSWRKGFLGRALEKAATSLAVRSSSSSGFSSYNWNPVYRLGTPETSLVALYCSLYVTALNTLSQMKHDILAGLSYKELILPHLWRFITMIGPSNPCRAFLDYLSLHSKSCAPEFQILIIFCECATHLITILDDIELYENQKPFRLDDLILISYFLNNFVFKILWHNLIDIQNMSSNTLLNSTHSLLMLLYKRDCRRPFTPPDHWLIKELRVSSFMKDLEHGKKSAQTILQKIPHIIPHKERVVLFRKYIANDKQMLQMYPATCIINSPLITIHRSRIVEDGYQQLNSVPSQALKGIIRVRFINEQGLDEAGIDQHGVFKEFLEDTIKHVFDPGLNLFRITSEQRLYPSPTSYIHENHLSLFEFVGKMLGKAVYEGIVVDVPFASFFLSQVLGQQQSALYSSIDELPSLDPELYKSLTYLKHYDDGDISQLDLTFSVDEDCMGEIVTHELLHGGKAIPVTKETRINYIHLMAHFRMHTQIHEQTAAFIRGFRSIINLDWLSMFSTPEFQRIISGDNTPIDLEDLRKHTKYFGGFHPNHRVICWLWDILQNDFLPNEHRLFLKFVTSCSKPPLLGFAHLEPPFSIRCVEVSDDQDTGDTLGSVLRGFFSIGRKDPVSRLPTSSTCFNLLKLPNYQRKNTLKEKLRYAIYSNTGFELS